MVVFFCLDFSQEGSVRGVITRLVMIFMKRNYIFVVCARLAKRHYYLYIFAPLIDYS